MVNRLVVFKFLKFSLRHRDGSGLSPFPASDEKSFADGGGAFGGGPATVAPCARARLTADRRLHRAALKTRREIKFIAHLATE
jgi:hypothetical protein